MSNSSTNRKYYEDGSGRVEYNAYNGENYYSSGEFPIPKYIGGLGDRCVDKSQCHENLYCYNSGSDTSNTGVLGVCSHWSPLNTPFIDKSITIKRSPNSDIRLCTYGEDCPGGWVCVNNTCQIPVGNKEGFIGKLKDTKGGRQLQYTSKYKANSGRNYYSYDETY